MKILSLMKKLFLLILFCNLFQLTYGQQNKKFRVVGYYCGTSIPVDSFETEKLTHLIFCFGGLNQNQFYIRSTQDSATIKRMVLMKSKNPSLKVMLFSVKPV